MIDWSYHAWPTGEPYEWPPGGRTKPEDRRDFHVDLGCGKVKKGRIGVDRYAAPGVNVVADLNLGVTAACAPEPGRDAVEQLPDGRVRVFSGQGDGFMDYAAGAQLRQLTPPGRLPFATDSIESMVSHHALEHIGDGFLALMDECWRVLRDDAPFRIIVPLFPSTAAVEDPDHRRYFMDGTFDALCGTREQMWCESFSVPYAHGRWRLTDKDVSPPTPPEERWTTDDRREIRVTLRAVKS